MTPEPRFEGAGRLTVAMTGGSGRVGSLLRAKLASRFSRLTVIDIAEPAERFADETFHRADLTDFDQTVEALAGHDAIIHLAGHPGERSLDAIIDVNVRSASYLYEAARMNGIDRVVLGSSNHVMGLYPRGTKIGSEEPMRPDTHYGLSKCWGELVAGLYFDKAGIRTFIIRIGNAAVQAKDARALNVWISAADLAQLTLIGLLHPEVDVTTVYGVGAGGGDWWDNSVATRLGYEPRDRAADLAHPDAFAPVPPDADPIGEHFQGGRFCSLEHDGVIRDRRGGSRS